MPLTDDIISSVYQDIHNQFPKIQLKILSRQDIIQKCHLQVSGEFKEKCILFDYQEALSIDKYDLGLTKNVSDKTHLLNKNPMYRKQFTIMVVHHQFINETLDEWIKLGVVKRLNLLCNSPIVCIKRPRIMKYFRELNQNYHINKYSMKEIIECIGDIGGANSTIISTLDLTSGFLQMKLDEESQDLTAFNRPISFHTWDYWDIPQVLQDSWRVSSRTLKMS